jgi:heme-degrading monooxygenase HmoA
MSYVIIWTYDVTPGEEESFRAAYGAEGDWATLFSRTAGFRGVELMYDSGRCVTVEYWESEAAYDAFHAEHGAAYQALDAKLAPLTSAQQRIGAFTSVP